MQNKLRPGDTFQQEVNGVTYDIRVLSVGEKLDIEDRIAALKDVKTAREHLQAWLEIVEASVAGWSLDEPFTRLRYTVDESGLGDLLDAVLTGNQPDEADRKN